MNLVYKKVTKKNSSSMDESGKLVNLITTDANCFLDSLIYMNFAILSPFLVIAIVVIMYTQIKYFCFISLGVCCLVIPFNVIIGNAMTTNVDHMQRATDFRVNLVNELIHNIRIIKYYAWEQPFTKRINSARKKEIHELKQYFYWLNFMVALMMFVPELALIPTFAAYVYSGNELTPGKMFSVFMLIFILQTPFTNLASVLSYLHSGVLRSSVSRTLSSAVTSKTISMSRRSSSATRSVTPGASTPVRS